MVDATCILNHARHTSFKYLSLITKASTVHLFFHNLV